MEVLLSLTPGVLSKQFLDTTRAACPLPERRDHTVSLVQRLKDTPEQQL